MQIAEVIVNTYLNGVSSPRCYSIRPDSICTAPILGGALFYLIRSTDEGFLCALWTLANRGALAGKATHRPPAAQSLTLNTDVRRGKVEQCFFLPRRRIGNARGLKPIVQRSAGAR
jgi:hypothetical protein